MKWIRLILDSCCAIDYKKGKKKKKTDLRKISLEMEIHPPPFLFTCASQCMWQDRTKKKKKKNPCQLQSRRVLPQPHKNRIKDHRKQGKGQRGVNRKGRVEESVQVSCGRGLEEVWGWGLGLGWVRSHTGAGWAEVPELCKACWECLEQDLRSWSEI